MNLISIIEESEKSFDEKFGVLEVDPEIRGVSNELKSHNRQTILKLVEGIEKWAEEKKTYFELGAEAIPMNEFSFLLQPLKDKLKQ